MITVSLVKDILKRKFPSIQWNNYEEYEVTFKSLGAKETAEFLKKSYYNESTRFTYWTDTEYDVFAVFNGRLHRIQVGRNDDGHFDYDKCWVPAKQLIQQFAETNIYPKAVIEIHTYTHDIPGDAEIKTVTIYKLDAETIKREVERYKKNATQATEEFLEEM